MDNPIMVWIGVGIACAVGVACSVTGTYRSISRAQTPDAKKTIVRLSVYAWVGISVFLALMFALPSPYSFLLCIPYGIGLGLFIRHANRQVACSGKDERGEV